MATANQTKIWQSIKRKLTEEEIAIMQTWIDDSDPNRLATEQEMYLSREQVRIGRRLTMAEYHTLRPMGGPNVKN